MSAEVQELAVRYGAAWAKHDLDSIMAMHTDDTVFHLHGSGESAVGRTAVQEAFAAGMAQWPDIRFERNAVYIGDDHFVTQYRLSATTPDGNRISCDGADVFAVENGKVARKDTYLDWPALQQQLAHAALPAVSAQGGSASVALLGLPAAAQVDPLRGHSGTLAQARVLPSRARFQGSLVSGSLSLDGYGPSRFEAGLGFGELRIV